MGAIVKGTISRVPAFSLWINLLLHACPISNHHGGRRVGGAFGVRTHRHTQRHGTHRAQHGVERDARQPTGEGWVEWTTPRALVNSRGSLLKDNFCFSKILVGWKDRWKCIIYIYIFFLLYIQVYINIIDLHLHDIIFTYIQFTQMGNPFICCIGWFVSPASNQKIPS